MEFLQIQWQSPWYDKAIALRDQILRRPLGLIFTASDLAEETNHWHFGLAEADELIAIVVIVPLSSERAKLRQMAVAENRQREGLGARLVREVEAVLRDRGFKEIELNARDVATQFYKKLGYRSKGAPFIEVSIPHWKMVKKIATERSAETPDPDLSPGS
jgi:predicted GNAT family N-acyltransferase